MEKNLQKGKLWCTWESQRRNRELSAAFEAKLLEVNLDGQPRLKRYLLSSLATVKSIIGERPSVVFSQCPSIILSSLCLILRPFFGYKLVLDAHNAALENLNHSNPLIRFIASILISRANFVIVSNPALKDKLASRTRNAVVLPDKLPVLHPSKVESQISKPAVVYISSFASDEPTKKFLTAFKETSSAFTLYVTGKRSKAKELLRFESSKIVFTDFLPHEDYDRLITDADLLIDLTTREDCLVCGAYEALAAGRPCILSDSQANRSLFSDGGFLFSENEEQEFIKALQVAALQITSLTNEMESAKKSFQSKWEEQFKKVQLALDNTP